MIDGKAAGGRMSGLGALAAGPQERAGRRWMAFAAVVCGLGLALGCSKGRRPDGSAAPKVFQSEDEFRAVVLDKSPEQVMAAAGKPDHVHPAGRLTSGERYEEVWVYHDRLVHRVSGNRQSVKVFFRGSRVVETEVR